MKFYSSKDLAKYLEVSESCVARWVSQGMPSEIGEGLRYNYELEEVLKWLSFRSVRHRRYVESLLARLENKGQQDEQE